MRFAHADEIVYSSLLHLVQGSKVYMKMLCQCYTGNTGQTLSIHGVQMLVC